MVNQINGYIEKEIFRAKDIELVSENRVLLILDDKKILLTDVSLEMREQIYDRFAQRFFHKRKKSKKKVEWTSEEIMYLKDNYSKEKIEDISKKLDKSEYQINIMLSELSILKKRNWEEYELEFLEKNLEKQSIWIAGKLNRSISSIKSKKRIIKNKQEELEKLQL
ncbi:hypothetical protein [Cetobacterium sp.]|uniref:hypothetical protein n=1 Tax=Cetobacterium sp. TaxID=2071632 RepID=UPI003F2F4877